MEANETNPLSILQLARDRGATATRRSTGLRRLRTCPENRRLLKHIDRSLSEVQHDLLALFDRLVAGTAPWPLFLHGTAGGGKTCGSLALCDVLDSAAYWEGDRFTSFVLHRSDEVDAELCRLADKELLVIDELGTRKTNDLSFSALKMLLDVREQQAGRASIVISNVRPEEIETIYDERIASRVLCGSIFELSGDDRREACR